MFSIIITNFALSSRILTNLKYRLMRDYKDIIQRIRSIDLNDDSKTKEIRALLSQLRFPIILSNAEAGSYVTRARRGKGYRDKQDMSYKPSSLCKTYQRATLPNQTVFYGIISDDERHLENARAIGVSECSVLADNGYNSIGREYISVSQWVITENIVVACIVSANSFKDVHNNRLLENLRQNFINKHNDDEEALFVSDFIVEEYSKKVVSGHDNEYKISAIFADMLLYEAGFEAVAYPSVKLGGQAGLNIAIRPDVADSKLTLLNIADQCFYKNAGHGTIRLESIYDVIRKYERPAFQQSDSDLCRYLGILSIDDLPLIN